MKIKLKMGLPAYRLDSGQIQECLIVWKKEVVAFQSGVNTKNEYWDSMSSCSSF